MKETFTLEEVKKAFWDTFHGAGELWFNYFGFEEEIQDSTTEHWEDFAENLTAKP